ncbi:MAG: 50S ribosomal protein L18 [Candidatus Anoxychlamydiales bacterium]|nr:50S ribosomal protein L18 [Candidatus Anoxychlamydiales bacterium]
MESEIIKRNISRKRRKLRVSKKLRGDINKPRMSVTKTNKHLFVQLIDDENGKTLLSVGTYSKDVKLKKSKDAAIKLGQKIAEMAKSKKIRSVIFDRGRLKYHGIIAEFADSARKAGLII